VPPAVTGQLCKFMTTSAAAALVQYLQGSPRLLESHGFFVSKRGNPVFNSPAFSVLCHVPISHRITFKDFCSKVIFTDRRSNAVPVANPAPSEY